MAVQREFLFQAQLQGAHMQREVGFGIKTEIWRNKDLLWFAAADVSSDTEYMSWILLIIFCVMILDCVALFILSHSNCNPAPRQWKMFSVLLRDVDTVSGGADDRPVTLWSPELRKLSKTGLDAADDSTVIRRVLYMSTLGTKIACFAGLCCFLNGSFFISEQSWIATWRWSRLEHSLKTPTYATCE